MRAFLALIAILLIIPLASAHLEGERVEEGDYGVEFSKAPDPPTLDDTTTLIFALEDASAVRQSNVPAFVRLTRNDRIVLASTDLVTDWNGVVGIAYRLQPGEYQALVRFTANETVEHTFTFSLPEPEGVSVSWTWLLLGLIGGLAAGFAIKWVLA